jgi:catechol 2,3-dioxygenase-like lactoylglutathione lyase family enzyme
LEIEGQREMTVVPTGTESARPFLPAQDLAKSRAFYEALGFKKLLDGDVVIFAAGATSFILQAFYDEHYANNYMMQLMVDDLDAWWAHISALDLPGKFGVPAPRPPAMQPWGLRIAYVVDPCGILWHIAQRRPGKPAD